MGVISYPKEKQNQICQALIREENRAVRRRKIAFAITPFLILALVAGYAYLVRVYLPKARRANDYKKLINHDVEVGDTLVFGNGEWENTWLVLAVEDSKVLIVNEMCIEERIFDDRDRDWDECTLRSWLNDEYYEYGFNEDERALICDQGQGGIFILSHQELGQYFYCEKDRIAKYIASPTFWWLRTESDYHTELSHCQLFVYTDGTVDAQGMIRVLDIGVRPAMWLEVGD